jgi:putative restriction endonuclease
LRYWWVNQNQTYRHEIGGQYLWSPKRKANGHRNPYYEFMREVAPGDLVFSFVDTRIPALGIARSYSYESPKPTEFGAAGTNWSAIGWKIEVAFKELKVRIRPKDHIEKLGSFLPNKYSPLSAEGNGSESVYLTAVPDLLAQRLLQLIGPEATEVIAAAAGVRDAERVSPAPEPALQEWERRLERTIRDDPQIPQTERQALVLARKGQGRFRSNVQQIERACRVTKVERAEHLIASHIRPWRDCSNEERLNGENGLLLTPTIDHLFDKGFISFEDSGTLILAPVVDIASIRKMGITPEALPNVGSFSDGQRQFLDYHRDNVLKMSRIKRP